MGPSDDEEDRQRDIDDVIREEKARRRPIDMDAIREAIRLRRDYWKLLDSGSEAMFRDYLTELGWKPGSPEFERFVRTWRALQK